MKRYVLDSRSPPSRGQAPQNDRVVGGFETRVYGWCDGTWKGVSIPGGTPAWGETLRRYAGGIARSAATKQSQGGASGHTDSRIAAPSPCSARRMARNDRSKEVAAEGLKTVYSSDSGEEWT